MDLLCVLNAYSFKVDDTALLAFTLCFVLNSAAVVFFTMCVVVFNFGVI